MPSINLEQYLWFRCIVPSCVLALLCYASWAFCHQLCYNAIYKDFGEKSVAIGLMVGEVLLVLILAITLAQIICIGPGQQPKLLPFRIVADSESESDEKDGSEAATRSIKPPRIYQCDPQGYPIWCTACLLYTSRCV